MTVSTDVSGGVPDDVLHTTSGRSAPTHGDHKTKHDVDELAGVIERARTCGDEQTIWMSRDDVQLPGFGDARPDCGEEFPFFCSACGETKSFGRTCFQSQCPRCAASWARRTATRVVAKLLALRAYRDSFMESHQRLHHVTNSFDVQSEHCPTGAEQALDLSKKLLKTAGLEGWLAYHPYRGRDGDDRGAWKERLFDDRDWDDVEDDLVWSPHVHGIVVGHHTPGGNVTKELEERVDWVLHRITKEDSSVSLYDEFDVARAVTYCLSHVGTYETEDGQRRAATRWFGEHINDVTASPLQEAKVDHVVRAVAPKTLGLPLNRLSCSEEHAVDGDDVAAKAHDFVVDHDRAQGSARYWQLGPSAASPDDAGGDDLWESGSGLVEATGDDPPDDPDAPPDTERCRGRLLPIAKAAPYLASSEWMRRAAYADETAAKHAEWVEQEPWIPDVDDASDEQISTVEFILGEDPDAGPDAPPPG
jgi:hypothetical protein